MKKAKCTKDGVSPLRSERRECKKDMHVAACSFPQRKNNLESTETGYVRGVGGGGRLEGRFLRATPFLLLLTFGITSTFYAPKNPTRNPKIEFQGK